MAKLPLELHPDARADAIDAFDWHAERYFEIANAFRQELQDAGRAIQDSPERWAKYLAGTRRYLMKRFPFVIVYRVASARIEIVAVTHGSRKPFY